jgi:hypothetical protein
MIAPINNPQADPPDISNFEGDLQLSLLLNER